MRLWGLSLAFLGLIKSLLERFLASLKALEASDTILNLSEASFSPSTAFWLSFKAP